MRHWLTILLLLGVVFAAGADRRRLLSLKKPAAAGGSTFVSDTMTGSDSTDLTAHTGEIGATWAKVTGVTGIIKLTSNRCKGDSGGVSLYYASGAPADADYEVEADIFIVTGIDQVGVCGRLSTGAHTCYRAWYDHANGRWSLDSISAGTPTNLGTYTQTLSNGATYNLRLSMVGTAIKVFIDDVERISVTNSAISSAGKAGIYYENSDWGFGSTGRAIDTFTATD